MTDPTAASGGEQQHEPQQRSGMGKWVALAPVVLILVAMGAIGFHHATRNKIRHEAGSLSGQQLYDMYCARCHMPNLQGAGAYPSVVARDISLEEMSALVLSGKNDMPAFKDMAPADLEKLHAFVAEQRASSR
jgi:mono/diheme cytochrome c family protein